MAKPNSIGLAVEAARGGDLAAFATLVEVTQDMAYAVAWQVLRQESDARDVVQESYILAFKRLTELLEPDAFPGWLRRIVVASSLNHRRLADVGVRSGFHSGITLPRRFWTTTSKPGPRSNNGSSRVLF